MNGRDRTVGGHLARAALAAVEPFYKAAVSVRNIAYERGMLKPHSLGRPAICVGNLTTGGTGKTPMVLWLADRLRTAGRHPAILMRGYSRSAGGASDEQALFDAQLNRFGDPPVIIRAGVDRVAAAAGALAEHPEIGCFILDDGLQHRRAMRDLEVTLIDATEPFGFGRVLPRGLLREPISGLGRAGVVIITRSDQTNAFQLGRIEQTVRRYNPGAPILRARHQLKGILAATDDAAQTPMPLESALADHPYFAFAGIGNPSALRRQLLSHGTLAGARWFPDHHDYDDRDLRELADEAATCGAGALVTTEKDWMKIRRLAFTYSSAIPIFRVAMEISFVGEGELLFLKIIGDVIEHA